MSKSLLEELVESRRRWLIVTAVTFGIALATLLPQVDQYLAARTERTELEEQIARASQTAKALPKRETRVKQQTADLEKLRDRQVDEKRVASLRNWLVEAAREAGCQVRRIDIGKPEQRTWADEDSPYDSESPTTENDLLTPFNLHKRRVALSITGSSHEIRSLLAAIDQDKRLKHPNHLEIRPDTRRRQIQLDLTLWYFALVRAPGMA